VADRNTPWGSEVGTAAKENRGAAALGELHDVVIRRHINGGVLTDGYAEGERNSRCKRT
jgi:hypothetical protein